MNFFSVGRNRIQTIRWGILRFDPVVKEHPRSVGVSARGFPDEWLCGKFGALRYVYGIESIFSRLRFSSITGDTPYSILARFLSLWHEEPKSFDGDVMRNSQTAQQQRIGFSVFLLPRHSTPQHRSTAAPHTPGERTTKTAKSHCHCRQLPFGRC